MKWPLVWRTRYDIVASERDGMLRATLALSSRGDGYGISAEINQRSLVGGRTRPPTRADEVPSSAPFSSGSAVIWPENCTTEAS